MRFRSGGKERWEELKEQDNGTEKEHLVAFVEKWAELLSMAIDGGAELHAGTAMAMVTARTESQHFLTAFSHKMVPVTVSPRQRLDDVIRHVGSIIMGGTDCALPMLYALENGIDADAFIVYTDSETWAGTPHPFQALQRYRELTGIPAKLVVVGMVSNGFSIADPSDAGMLDVVGFDTASPSLIGDFIS
jgi:60 kDa SS-A/Ro ribonucleoprotein